MARKKRERLRRDGAGRRTRSIEAEDDRGPLYTNRMFLYPEHTRWSVFFIRNGEINRKRFGSDYHEALEYYTKLKIYEDKGGKISKISLGCDNYGFPPPEKYIDRMDKVNDKGIHWCPFCIQMRKFELMEPFIGEINHDHAGYYCMFCEISHRNELVRRYNPGLAQKPYYFD